MAVTPRRIPIDPNFGSMPWNSFGKILHHPVEVPLVQHQFPPNVEHMISTLPNETDHGLHVEVPNPTNRPAWLRGFLGFNMDASIKRWIRPRALHPRQICTMPRQPDLPAAAKCRLR